MEYDRKGIEWCRRIAAHLSVDEATELIFDWLPEPFQCAVYERLAFGIGGRP